MGLPHTPPEVSEVGALQGALEGAACSAALRDSLDAFIARYVSSWPCWRQPSGPPEGRGAFFAD